MFNNDLKKNALASLEKSQEKFNIVVTATQKYSVDLFNIRRKCSDQLIVVCEEYINTLANSPKEFDRSFSEFKAEIKEFDQVLSGIENEFAEASFKAGSTAGAGAIAGAGVAALAPTAAMAIATTFGTASTGTLISTLGGAAATNAALAWLGGGALAVGGGGMAAGNTLLALAGPVGWGIGAVALAGGGIMARKKNKEISEKAQKEDKKIRTEIRSLETTNHAIQKIVQTTEIHSDGSFQLLNNLKESAPNNYREFSDYHKQQLGALINHMNSLSALINKKVQ